ncbi:MAG: SMC-Scp complex subunit ScpB [Ruminococcus sp.]|nr:SMC-Scp complex subunit ScpB [Ruminococcus sp.]
MDTSEFDIITKTAAVEAILFAGGDPIESDKLALAAGVEPIELKEIIARLDEKYASDESGIELLKLEDCFQLATKQRFAPQIKEAFEIKKNSALSAAAMEVLTIVAYNQPVTKSFVENVRGVDSSSTVNSLVEKGLLCEAGRLELPGRPIAYKTTDAFLRSFQISSITELPPLPEQEAQVTIDEIIENQETDGE